MAASCPNPEPGSCLIARLDYGFPDAGRAGWREGSLSSQRPWEILEGAPAGEGLVLREADLLVGWARTRSQGDLWGLLAARARGGGLLLQCRFPRRAAELSRRLAALGPRLAFWETPADGSVPPLYEETARTPALLRLHLQYEWRTGIGEARGGAALWGAAFCLAASEPLSAPDMSRSLGVTAGAARSYLTWMEDAALVRRVGGAFALRHPLLKTLFGIREGHPAAPTVLEREAVRPPPRPRWNPEEID